jgi:hypothetical protein
MTDTPRKPFWKRTRWIALAVVWLALPPVAYLASLAPASYCHGRGWARPPSVYFEPYRMLARHDAAEPLRHYTNWGWIKGKEHREADARRRAMNPDNAFAWVPPLPPP